MPCVTMTPRPASKRDYAEWQKMGYTGTYEQYAQAKERFGAARIIMCGDLDDVPVCADCGMSADLLCDFPVGNDKTCDRALCYTHAQAVAPEVDYCQAHYAEWRKFVDAGGVDDALKNVVAFGHEKKAVEVSRD